MPPYEMVAKIGCCMDRAAAGFIFGLCSDDGPAAEDVVVLVEDRGLPRRDRPLGFVELEHRPVLRGDQQGVCHAGRVAQLGLHPAGGVQSIHGDVIHVLHGHPADVHA